MTDGTPPTVGSRPSRKPLDVVARAGLIRDTGRAEADLASPASFCRGVPDYLAPTTHHGPLHAATEGGCVRCAERAAAATALSSHGASVAPPRHLRPHE